MVIFGITTIFSFITSIVTWIVHREPTICDHVSNFLSKNTPKELVMVFFDILKSQLNFLWGIVKDHMTSCFLGLWVVRGKKLI
jgi:hypothetical protein